MEDSHVPVREWLVAIQLFMESGKVVFSVKAGDRLGGEDRLVPRPPRSRLHGRRTGRVCRAGGNGRELPRRQGEERALLQAAQTGGGDSGNETVIGVKDRATNRVKAEHVLNSYAD